MYQPCIAIVERNGETVVLCQGNYRQVLNKCHELKQGEEIITIYRFTSKLHNGKFLAKE